MFDDLMCLRRAIQRQHIRYIRVQPMLPQQCGNRRACLLPGARRQRGPLHKVDRDSFQGKPVIVEDRHAVTGRGIRAETPVLSDDRNIAGHVGGEIDIDDVMHALTVGEIHDPVGQIVLTIIQHMQAVKAGTPSEAPSAAGT